MRHFLRKQIIKALNHWVRGNATITRLLFGVRVEATGHIHWDFTTLALKNCLRRHIRSGSAVLEVGTGPYGILAIWLAKRVECNIVACDISDEYVLTARSTAERNGVKMELVRSDLFANIEGKFDTIFWNSIYIPKQVGRSLGIDKMAHRESDWCGGETGTEAIARFLEDAVVHLKEGGEILLGFNPMYLQESLVVDLCKSRGYDVKGVHKVFLIPSRVAVLGRML